MSVKINEDGSRSVQVEVEVAGTPEEVWRAIATGPGVSSWFVHADIEGREGGNSTYHFGPGMDDRATITAWQPPRRYTTENLAWHLDAPPLATEWVVEARDGGTCVVRVVHSLFASNDEWDDQLEGMEAGWPVMFRILAGVLSEFREQPCATVHLLKLQQASNDEVWSALAGTLGLAAAQEGEPCRVVDGFPPLSGVVELREATQMLVRLEQPAPGFATLGVCAPYLSLGLYLYGDEAVATLERDKPRWQAWMQQQFPTDSQQEEPS